MGYIELNDVSYQYPTSTEKVIKNINLSLDKGKLYAVVGSNGHGKTTLCNIIRGYIPHFYNGELEGEVIVDGRNVLDEDMGSLAATVGYIFENPFNQISGIKETVFEELAYGLENLGVERALMKEKVTAMVKMMGLEALQDKNPMKLSGGQQQRVAFASILIMETDIIVIDEPTSQLDPQSTEKIFKIIENLKNEGKTIILVEHKMDLISHFADEVIVMQEGEIKLHGPAKEVLTDPQLEAYGVPYTDYTKLGFKLREKGFNLSEIPTTATETKQVVNEIIK